MSGNSQPPGPGTVWTYWEQRRLGAKRSAYLDLCMETIRRHAAPLEVRELDAETSLEAVPDIDPERWWALPGPNFRSDYLRSRALHRFGGIFIDPDTIAMRPLGELLAELPPGGTVSFGREFHRFFGGLCVSAPGSSFTERWAAEQDRVLDESPDWAQLHYAALAQQVTSVVAATEPWTSLPMGRVAPVPWYQWRRFFSRLQSPTRVLAGSPVTIVLWNAVMWRYLRPRSHDELLADRMLLSRLLRIALGRSRPDEEEDAFTALHGLSDLRFSERGQKIEAAVRHLRGSGDES